ncbi:MAG: hypothetical protein E6094_08170 [Clostridium perfringens]|nr:hypothetical protein [Clostridium perfringens]
MSIQKMYEDIINKKYEDINIIKNEILNQWGVDNFDIDIIFDEIIRDQNGNRAFGGFYKDENIIKINSTEIISFVGLKICHDNLIELGIENCKKVFEYYFFYILAHELHHAYLYNRSKEEYIKIKEEDRGKDYKESNLEIYADNYAMQYLESISIKAKKVGELAINLRCGSYKQFKLEGELDEECRNRFIVQELKKIIN